jgi:hypothetical protein
MQSIKIKPDEGSGKVSFVCKVLLLLGKPLQCKEVKYARTFIFAINKFC